MKTKDDLVAEIKELIQDIGVQSHLVHHEAPDDTKLTTALGITYQWIIQRLVKIIREQESNETR